MKHGPGERLLERLDSRNVFVVGKGGVGKSTTAASLALAWANADRSTHLISTDPAHSLADVLDLPEDGVRLRERVCGRSLVVEEFDARGYADEWTREISAPVTELFDRGSYLDSDDIRSFLELSLPGVDEVMAGLRLTELQDGPAEKIVVDTAPTGHLLRLLDSGKVLASWIRALRALGRKASVVASHLTRSEVRLGAEEFVDDLEDSVNRFQEEVLAKARFVLVDRSGDVVEWESRRLRDALSERGLRLGARIRMGPSDIPEKDAEPELLFVPLVPDFQGCDALAAWTDLVTDEPPGPRPAAPSPSDTAGGARRAEPPSAVRDLLAHRLILVAGKGGVGKSTCAAALAVVAAESGATVLVSTDPAGSLESLFGIEIAGEGEVLIGDSLALRQLDAEAEFQLFRLHYTEEVEGIAKGIGVDGGAEMDRDVMDALLGLAPPGIDEIVALAAVMDLIEEDRIVVVDSAPTGHFLRLVALPELALAWTHTLMRALLKYRSVAGLGHTGERLLTLAQRLKTLRVLLTDPERTTVLLVTLDEPVVAAESMDLLDGVSGAGMPVGAWVANRVDGDPTHLRHAGRGTSPDVPVFVAPDLPDPPTGVEGLRAFLGRWTPREVHA